MSATMVETSRSLPARRASTRLSTYSVTPTLTPSVAPSRLSVAQSDPKHSLDAVDYSSYPNEAGNRVSLAPCRPAGAAPRFTVSVFPTSAVDDASLKSLQTRLQRLEDVRLQGQRFVVSERKKEEMSGLALGAKLERALGRRMSGQDAVFTGKKKGIAASEKL